MFKCTNDYFACFLIVLIAPEKLTANGNSTDDNCKFKQNNQTMDFILDIRVDECGITPNATDTTIYFPLQIIALNEKGIFSI